MTTVEYLIEDEDGAPFPDEFQQVAWDLIHRREAEARDATGLHFTDKQLDAAYAAGRYAFGAEQRRAEMRAALAAAPQEHAHRPEYPSACTGCEHLASRMPPGLAPQEPRWPSRDELAKALRTLPAYKSLDPRWADVDAKKIDAALREGAERP